ncbi:Hercynylcysteine sulfoxide lyase [Sparassis crispa]|uniref:Hercynylcysteine sulfoxide lyase n=1 Tax=Sparassis crispa TaxID=139825 RepID=A0A401H1T7_9APHY|nr:Hercynylcysteine sulfoxide lyase [Sparassis crispa]GBE88395.1 Hercynylcysteine sulfoxide lyase [Sparassis crispa]
MTAINSNDQPSIEGLKGHTYDAGSEPPPFGHALKHFWAFDAGYVNLNHGSYGSQPLPVIFASTKITMLAERNPDKFHRVTYMPMLKEARGRVANLIGAELDEVVLVPNATHGINTVLRNFEWKESDVMLGASTTYGAVSRTLQYLSDRSEQPRPTVHTIAYTFPMTHVEIVDRFRARIREIKQLYPDVDFSDAPSDAVVPEGCKKKNKFVAVIDSLTSNPGVLLPWKEMVRVCKEEGVWSLVDGAHSIGQEVDINLREAKPDFFISNCHKWLYVKRGCAVLYVPKRNQHIIKSSLPTSHEYVSPHDPPRPWLSIDGTNFVGQHEWTGTMDQTPFLSVGAALDFREWLGGEAKINAYCHDLAVKGGQRLAEVLGTKVMDESGELTLNMTNVLLPLPVESSPLDVYTPEILASIHALLIERLLSEWNTYAAYYFHGGAWWCRCSAQVWNELSDFEYAGKAFSAICEEVRRTILSNGDFSRTVQTRLPAGKSL